MILELTVFFALVMVGSRFLGATVPMDDDYWRSLRRADPRMFGAIFRIATQVHVINRFARQELLYRVLLVTLNTVAVVWLLIRHHYRIHLDGMVDALSNVLGPAVAWLITSHWYSLDLMHTRLEAARRYLQLKGKIQPD